MNQTVLAQEGLRDIRGPVNYPSHFLWVVVVVVLAAALVLVWLKKRKKKEPAVPPASVDPRAPWEIAFDEFDELIKSGLLEQGQFKVYYSRLGDIVRRYFENQFNIRAPEMTTEEFLWSLENSRKLTEPQNKALKKFLSSCDIVKFAKYVPNADEAKASFKLAKELVEELRA